MELASQDAELRAALFRFVDVTPACRSLDDLARHLAGYLEEVDDRPPPIEAAMRMSEHKAGPRRARRRRRRRRAPHGAPLHRGRDAEGRAARRSRDLWENGAAVSLDLLGEATVTAARGRPLRRALRGRARHAAAAAPTWPERPVLEADSLGPLPRVNLSVKVSALTPLLRPEAPEVGRDDAAAAPAAAARRARDLGAHLHIDMESVDTLEATHRASSSSCSTSPSCATGPSAGIVLQAYLRESPEQLDAGPRLGARRARASSRSSCGW